MKKNVCCILFTLIAICVVYISTFDTIRTKTINNNVLVKYVDSKILTDKIVKDTTIVDAVEDENITVESVQNIQNEIIEVKVQEDSSTKEATNESNEKEEIPTANTNEILTGKMSGYGPDCKGCSGYLAYGMYVGDGTTYYNDSEYGNVRIVAGDKKYKFGTIVKINNSMLAIVLDRGGSIGIGKKFLFDLLYASEAEAYQNGVATNVTFEILRNGF